MVQNKKNQPKIMKIKTSRFKPTLLLILISLSMTSYVFASNDYTKNFERKYTVKRGTQLNIENKYGDVEINNWALNEVLIKATITAEAPNQSKAESVFRNISINISQSGDVIKAITQIKADFKRGDKFNIDYEIFTPDYIQISLDNKFGDIYINAQTAQADINLSYGNLSTKKLLPLNNSDLNSISLSYAKANISECSRAKLSLKYSEVDIANSQTLVVASRFSKLHLNNNTSLVADSKYDAFNIINSESVQIKGEYSDIKAGSIHKSLSLNLKYGHCKITNVNSNFENISIDNQYAPTYITIAKEASYTLEAETQFCNINYPKNSQIITKEQNHIEQKIKAHVGHLDAPESKVSIMSKYGNIDLR